MVEAAEGQATDKFDFHAGKSLNIKGRLDFSKGVPTFFRHLIKHTAKRYLLQFLLNWSAVTGDKPPAQLMQRSERPEELKPSRYQSVLKTRCAGGLRRSRCQQPDPATTVVELGSVQETTKAAAPLFCYRSCSSHFAAQRMTDRCGIPCVK